MAALLEYYSIIASFWLLSIEQFQDYWLEAACMGSILLQYMYSTIRYIIIL